MTTVARAPLADPLPGVNVIQILDVPAEVRRITAARLPGPNSTSVQAALRVLHTLYRRFDTREAPVEGVLRQELDDLCTSARDGDLHAFLLRLVSYATRSKGMAAAVEAVIAVEAERYRSRSSSTTACAMAPTHRPAPAAASSGLLATGCNWHADQAVLER